MNESSSPDVPLERLPLEDLIKHIEDRHHGHTRDALSQLAGMAREVADRHGAREPRLQELAQRMEALRERLLAHLTREETVLFPAVRGLLAADLPGLPAPVMVGPLASMEEEHAEAGEALVAIRTLTDDYTPPEWADAQYRALLSGLEALELDLKEHMRKENEILFPRVRAYARDIMDAGD